MSKAAPRAPDALGIKPMPDRRGKMFAPLSADEKAVVPNTDTPKSDIVPIVPVPEDAPQMQYRHPKHGDPTDAWPYHDAQGGLVGYMLRWDLFNEEGQPDKTFRPVTYCEVGDGSREWRAKGFPAPWPLFGLPNILAKPGAPLIITEGEKKADTATKLFPDFAATTAPHGAKSPHKVDWSPGEGRSVVVWGDNDKVGVEYAEAVSRLCRDAGATSVSVVKVPQDFPEKWDLADEPPQGWTTEMLRDLLDTAEPIQPSPKTSSPTRETPFRLRPDGVYCRVEREDKPSGEVSREWVWFSSPLEVVAETRDADGQNWGRLLAIVDRDGTRHEWALPMEMLAGSGEEYRRRLLSMGLEIAPGTKARHWLHEYLSTTSPAEKARCVSRIGWHGRAFVLPDETLGDTDSERVLLQSVNALDHAFRVCGALADWQDHVARYAEGNSRLAFALSTAFAAPLLQPTGSDSGGFHLRGPSSIGKTTALHVAGSVWGGGGLRGYINQWRATDNGLEAVAQAHSDALLCLDELSQIDAKAAGVVAYMLANGSGKARAGRSGEGRTPAEWRTVFLSSGEIELATKVAEDGRGRKFTAGQQVRVIDIPADAGVGLGIFENLHGFASADTFANHLKEATGQYYGNAARIYLAEFTDAFDTVRENVIDFRRDFVAERCPQGADGQVSRVAAFFGLVAAAGELAAALGILPWPEREAFNATAVCFQAWMDNRGGIEPAEVTAGIAQVRWFIEQYGESRFTPWGEDGAARTPTMRAGFRKSDDRGGVEYFVLPEVWRCEVCTGFDAAALARALAERGMLRTRPDGKLQYSAKLPGFGGKPVSCYVVTSALFQENGHA